tara:strand:- start:891 stop:2237 length:1347 start_codon:yes stop_codon:yes gene_type:complete
MTALGACNNTEKANFGNNEEYQLLGGTNVGDEPPLNCEETPEAFGCDSDDDVPDLPGEGGSGGGHASGVTVGIWGTIPTAPAEPNDYATTFSVGRFHACVIWNGEFGCWGKGDSGQLGAGSYSNRSYPAAPNGLATEVVSVGAGYDHTCTIQNGLVKCFGSNSHGQLGNYTAGNKKNQFVTVIKGDGTQLTKANDVAAGAYFSCANTESGVYCWGKNNYGQLGDGTHFNSNGPVKAYSTEGIQVATGRQHACLIKKNKKALCWGYNYYGQLGINNTTNKSSPQVVSGNISFKKIGAGFNHTCGLTTSGDVYCWGFNNDGQLGRVSTTTCGSAKCERTPKKVDLSGIVATDLAVGDNSTCVIGDGRLLCWGKNTGNLISKTDSYSKSFFEPVQHWNINFGAKNVSIGASHACVKYHNNYMQCWGDNNYGQLGTGDTSSHNDPQSVIGTY